MTTSIRRGTVVIIAAVAFLGLTSGAPIRPVVASAEQHVWLHYDYMVGADGHSDAPNPASIQLVVDAFAAHGIQLHIDPAHAAIPAHRLIIPDFDPGIPRNACPGYDEVNFTDLEARYFHPTANHEWHYMIFGEYVYVDNCNAPFGTGYSEIPGDNFVVALGFARKIGLQITPYLEGGTFMHELGHNLGLRHGGNVDDNFKSNYLSVMNYLWQFGLVYAASPGSTSIAGRKLDYSEEALPSLDEAHLNENVGLGATLPTDNTDITSWEGGQLGFGIAPASGPIDWNQNGVATDSDVAVDLDLSNDPFEGGDYDVQTGFDDWAAIHAYLSGTYNPGPKTFPHEYRAAEPLVTGISPSVGSVAGGTQVTITGAHFEKATAVSFGGHLASSFTVLNDGTLTAITPPGAGTVDVVVTAGDNPSPSVQSDQFTYVTANVSAFSPA